ncbi:MAG: transposase [Myxococcota bacterium]|jgi:transposase
MPRPLSVDLREWAVEAYLKGSHSQANVARRFGVGEATLKRWIWLKRDTGSVAPRPMGGDTNSVLDEDDRAELRALVEEHPDSTLFELAKMLDEARSKAVSTSTIGRTLRRMRITRKKSRS